jgi:hypothetical protein
LRRLPALVLGCGANLFRIQADLCDEAITAGFARGHLGAAVAVIAALADLVADARVWADQAAKRFGFVFTKAFPVAASGAYRSRRIKVMASPFPGEL